jgi:hypothetical protein
MVMRAAEIPPVLCPKCQSEMIVTARQPHPINGPSHTLVTFHCKTLSCAGSVMRSMDPEGRFPEGTPTATPNPSSVAETSS